MRKLIRAFLQMASKLHSRSLAGAFYGMAPVQRAVNATRAL